MTTYDNGFAPTGNETWNARNNDWFSKDSSSSIYQVIMSFISYFFSLILLETALQVLRTLELAVWANKSVDLYSQIIPNSPIR